MVTEENLRGRFVTGIAFTEGVSVQGVMTNAAWALCGHFATSKTLVGQSVPQRIIVLLWLKV